MKFGWIKSWYFRVVVCCYLIIFSLLFTLGGYYGAQMISTPRRENIEMRPTIGDKPNQEVTIQTEDGLKLSAWLTTADPTKAVILLHGHGGNRRHCIRNAEFYLQQGYTVLLPDLRASGKSEGEFTSLGYHERNDLIACYRFLKEKGYTQIGAHGISLGAATICYAAKDLPQLTFAVLESSYDTVAHAIDNRVRLWNIPYIIGWSAKYFFAFNVRATLGQLSPLEDMRYCTMPTLVMGGDSEGFLTVAETTSLYERCPAKIKRLHIFKGGTHENFIRKFEAECTTELKTFLAAVPS